MIIVFGSLGMELGFPVATLPQPGETVMAPDYDMEPGGKAAAQALAAARCGSKVAVVGKVGADSTGQRVLESLRREGVMTSGVGKSETLPTGFSIIMHDRTGQKQRIVAPGANAEASASQIPDEILGPSSMVVLQMEASLDENISVLVRAKAHGAKTMLNLAPAIRLPHKGLEMVDYLIVNHLEARQIAALMGMDVEDNALRIAQALSKDGNLTCIVTLGAHGAVAVTAEGKAWKIPALPIADRVVDITGAGDAYCGTLAAGIMSGLNLPRAMKRASIAGSLACLGKGGMRSFPYSADIEAHLKDLADPEVQTLS